jgi:type VI secretion system protein ImpF
LAELSLQERLQPALLDRLTDDEPEKRTESREQRVISLAKLRSCVLRDLSWLLNSARLSTTTDLSDHPDAERSVLNYGVPGFAGGSASTLAVSQTEEAIREAILRFEPRLLPNTVKVKLLAESLNEEAHNTITLEIEAELWCQPMPLHMYMKTEVDLEIGAARVTEQTESQRSEHRRRRR